MWQLVSDITAWETKAGGSPQVQGQLLNIARSCLKKERGRKNPPTVRQHMVETAVVAEHNQEAQNSAE